MSLIIFDTETGGLQPHHPTIQIAGIAVDAGWREVDWFERKITFDQSQADPQALHLNSYNREQWAEDAAPLREAMDRFDIFLRKHADVTRFAQRSGRPYTVARLCGHNIATFDLPRVEADFKQFYPFFPADYRALDTLQLFRWLRFVRPDLPESGKLTDIASYYGIDAGGAHDALADCRLVAAVAPLIISDMAKGCAA